MRHDRTAHALAAMARRGMDSQPRLEQVLPQLTERAKGEVAQPRMDVVAYDGTARMLIDVVIVSPLAGDSRFVRSCARRDGHACRRAAAFKRGKYPHAELVPFAAETGGRLSGDARRLLKLMAERTGDPERELAFMQRAISSTIQSGVARMLKM